MKADKPSSLVPKLRFPEFRGAGDWHFLPLSDIAQPITQRVGTAMCMPLSVSAGIGLVSQEEKFGRTIAGDSYKNYIRLQTNDFAYNKSATKEFPQGYIARYSGTKDAAVPKSIFACFRPDIATVIPEYLDHLFHRNHHGRWLRKYIMIGSRAHGALSVSNNDLMAMPVPLPPDAVSNLEQQKIADCLSSVDDLIVAEGQKLESLRQHKRGLMQQLFPRTGETVPRLRFPEFHNDGNWGSKKLGQVCRISTGKKDANEGCSEGPYPFFTCAEKHIFSSSYSFDTEAILVAGNANVGLARYYKGKFEAYQRTYVLTEFADIDVPYLFSILSNCLRPTLLSQVQTSAMSYIRLPMLQAYEFTVPKSFNEQRKIADCLGSLDDLIVAESRKLESLQFQKQGLMQQLFPSLDHN